MQWQCEGYFRDYSLSPPLQGSVAAALSIDLPCLVSLPIVPVPPCSTGMSCPADVFLSKPFLQSACALLHPDGVLAVNVVARSQTQYARAVHCLKEVQSVNMFTCFTHPAYITLSVVLI